jgi:thiamine biosynthesis lipoprotein
MPATSPRTPRPVGDELALQFERFGGLVELRATPAPGQAAQARAALQQAVALLADFDERLSRFDAASELCRLNADPAEAVDASPLMQRFAEAVAWAGGRSGGLVDATCLPDVERAGYVGHLELPPAGSGGLSVVPPPAGRVTTATATHRSATRPANWRDVTVADGRVRRPVGTRLDSGGIGKGLAADLAGALLQDTPAWVVDCGGDLRIGGTARVPRAVDVRDPLDPQRVLHRLHVTGGGVATSGITRRAWGEGPERRHHLIDPRTGEPAATGILQVTALAPTALEAEVLAKTALLAGRDDAHARLEYGGVIVDEDGVVLVVAPPAHQRRPHRPALRVAFQRPGHPAVRRRLEPRR